MSDLIRRESAIEAIKQATIHSEDENLAIEALENLPSAERKGKWIHDPDPDAGLGWYTCSECGHNDYEDPDFCPNCGADMRGEDDERSDQ